MTSPPPPLRARLQLVAATALLAAALAFPADDPSAVPVPAPAAPAADSAPAASAPLSAAPLDAASGQLAALEEDAAKTAEAAGGVKNNKKRSQAVSSAIGNVLAPRDNTPETVSLSPQIPDPQKKGNAIQGVLLNILQPKPIVDMIREEDKYGNSGDRFAVIGRGVVAGFEGFSNILNKVLDFPFETAKKVSRSATEALNQLGSRLIGL